MPGKYNRAIARWILALFGIEPQTPKMTSPQVRHPAAGRFCHICGADSFKNEPCDSGLHG